MSFDVFPLSRPHISSNNKLGNLHNKCGNLQNTGHVWMEQVLEVSEEEIAAENNFNIAMV